jgi:hypothetical protein
LSPIFCAQRSIRDAMSLSIVAAFRGEKPLYENPYV